MIPKQMSKAVHAEIHRITKECWRQNLKGKAAERHFNKVMREFIEREYPDLPGEGIPWLPPQEEE